MSWLDAAAVIAALSVGIGVLFLVRFLKRLEGSLSKIEDALEETEKRVDSLAGEAEEGLRMVREKAEPVLEAARETIEAYGRLERVLQAEIEGGELHRLFKEARGLTEEAHAIGRSVHEKVEKTRDAFEAVHEAGRAFRTAAYIVRSGLLGAAVQVASMATGVKASLEYVADNIRTGGEKR